MDNLTETLRAVRKRIHEAAERSGHNSESVKIVAVTKTFSAAVVQAAMTAGLMDIGENRVQEAAAKYAVIGKKVRWHLVGHLQTNKVKKAVEFFDMIHSVDSLRLAEAIDRSAQQAGKTMPVLIQVNTSEEESKWGCQPEHALTLLERMHVFDHIDVRGFMTIGPWTDNPEDARESFRKLRHIRDAGRQLLQVPNSLPELSMGMSGDFEAAVEEGATLIRLGTVLFGTRH